MSNIKKIKDIIEMSKQENADITILLLDAYTRGYSNGIDFATNAAIEAIRGNINQPPT